MTSELVREWAASILRQVGAPPDATLTVTARPGTGYAGPPATEDVATGPTDLEATLGFADGPAVSVELAADMSETEAVVLLADRFQDAVLEETQGAPRPPCPGHGHPAVAADVNGVPSWTCPHGMGRRTVPILREAAYRDGTDLGGAYRDGTG